MDKIKLIREEVLSWIKANLDLSSRYFETFESKEQLIKEIGDDYRYIVTIVKPIIKNYLSYE